MKKILILLTAIIFAVGIFNSADAACIQCPEIQKLIKKEFKDNDMKLTKEQKQEIKTKKKELKKAVKDYDKQIKSKQKQIDKILNADCPDIVKMMEVKKESAKISKDRIITIKSYYDDLFYVYTKEQQYLAKKVLSENSGIKTKKPCIFCQNELKPKCSNCKGK